MADKERKTVTIEGGRIIFPNFTGREGPFNAAGVKSFAVILDEDTARQMFDDGWNVKWLKDRDDEAPEEAVGDAYLPVAVSFKNRPPRIVMLTSTSRTVLNADTVELLDSADIASADMIINPSYYDVNGKAGTKAYLKTLFVTVNEDELERKYAVHDEGGE